MNWQYIEWLQTDSIGLFIFFCFDWILVHSWIVVFLYFILSKIFVSKQSFLFVHNRRNCINWRWQKFKRSTSNNWMTCILKIGVKRPKSLVCTRTKSKNFPCKSIRSTKKSYFCWKNMKSWRQNCAHLKSIRHWIVETAPTARQCSSIKSEVKNKFDLKVFRIETFDR